MKPGLGLILILFIAKVGILLFGFAGFLAVSMGMLFLGSTPLLNRIVTADYGTAFGLSSHVRCGKVRPQLS